jgi:hypothetical protein
LASRARKLEKKVKKDISNGAAMWLWFLTGGVYSKQQKTLKRNHTAPNPVFLHVRVSASHQGMLYVCDGWM